MNEHHTAMMVMTVFGLAAVVIILFQHAQSTQSILGALGTSASGSANANVSILGTPASLAGTFTVGGDGSSQPPPIQPLNISPGYILH